MVACCRAIVLCALVALLGACGGGGGGGSDGSVITVSVSYSGDGYLLQTSAIHPVLSGFDGHSPQCSLGSGLLPSGMSLNSDCSITGVPLEAGSFNVVVHIGASGVSNQLDWNVGFAVLGPSVSYPDVGSFSIGAAVDLAPLNTFWQPITGSTIVYSIDSGALPAGLTIDGRTGRISGQVASAGSYVFTVRADVTAGGQHASVVQVTPMQLVTSLPLSRGYPSTVGGFVGTLLDVSPTLPALSGATFDIVLTHLGQPYPLPLGLTFDAATGRIHGIPLEESLNTYEWAITENYQGLTQLDRGFFDFGLSFPIYVRYDDCISMQPCLSSPHITLNQATFANATYVYSFTADSFPLPPGLQLDAATGVISGTSLTGSGGNQKVNVTVTHDGVTFNLTAYFSLFN